jgi:hypothetical protein
MCSPPPSTRQTLLGLFVVGQLVYLVSANLIGFMKDNRAEMGPQMCQVVEAVAPGWPDERGHVWNLLEHLAKTDRMWSDLTGQAQTWSLFAPTIGRECVFPALELRWHDDSEVAPAPHATELVLSENEPTDPEHYFRIGNFRMRRYENNIALTLRPYAGETPEQTNERWRDAIRAHVTDYAQIIRGYMQWRLSQVMPRWAGREKPRQVSLVARRFHINDYEETPPNWSGPFDVPLARWRPQVNGEALAWYDPVDGAFKSLSK